MLAATPSESVDCCVTSPPYWGHRQYTTEGIGLESDAASYIARLSAILAEVQRVLRRTGSLWLNIGDTYVSKGLAGIHALGL